MRGRGDSLLTIVFVAKFNSGESKTTQYKNNACKMLKENPDWYLSLKASEARWKTPIHIQLGMIRQESSFGHDARPLRKNKWYEFWDNYASSAHGYSQALNGTWEHYLKSTNGVLKNRESFKDATDFIGWYNNNSNIKNNIALNNPKELYLAYHEGWNGYKNKTYEAKDFLKGASQNVVKWSAKYKSQLQDCKLTGKTDWFFVFSMIFDYLVVVLIFLFDVLSYLVSGFFWLVGYLYNILK